MRLISDEEIHNFWVKYGYDMPMKGSPAQICRDIAQAQLEACEKEVAANTAPPELLEATIQLRIQEKAGEIFEEIEKQYPHSILKMNPLTWDALKQKYLKEK